MNVNYDKEFEKAKSQATNGSKLLLHVCCAPCSTYCLLRVLDKFDVTLFYSNDNITNYDEWQKRLDEIQKLVNVVNNGGYEIQPTYTLKLVVDEFDSNNFFDVAKGLEGEKEGGLRCNECFKMRLGRTQSYALSNGFEYFGTTLTVSPYKNCKLLNQIGLELQSESLSWLPADFKKNDGYKQSVELSNKYHLYRQHYCGCEYSNIQPNA